MNWYKISQQIIDEDNERLPAYTQIGHFKDYDVGNVMWIWKGGELLTEKAGENSTHWETWRDENNYVGNFYRGRYDGSSKNVSIQVPYKPIFRNRPIPDNLIKALVREFGEDTKIHIYRS